MAKKKSWVPEIELTHSPTLFRFMESEAMVRFIVGPVGSGKTFACCFEMMIKAFQQEPNDDGYRPTRFAVIRNTMPDLKRTTIKTWLGCFPEDKTGKLFRTSPIHHIIKIPPTNWKFDRKVSQQPKNAVPGLDMEVHFFSLDREDDVNALLSFEATGIYFNECRQINKQLVNAATDRIGRYPSKALGGVMPTWQGVIGDTNPYDEYHWMFKLENGIADDDEDLFEADTADEFSLDDLDYEFFRQPPGVYEAKKDDGGYYYAIDAPHIKTNVLNEVQKAAGKFWIGNPGAENLANLSVKRKGESMISRWGYYLGRIANKELDWIRCYYQGKNTFVKEGKSVLSNFNPEVHVVDDLPILDGVPIEGGIDIGGGTLSPAIILGQRHPLTGAFLVHKEFCPSDMGVDKFGDAVLSLLENQFPDNDWNAFHTDPAAKQREQLYKTVVADVLRDKGLPVRCVSTNEIDVRISSIKTVLGRWDIDRPGMIISRRGCPRLIKGMSGGWHFKKRGASVSETMHRDVPEKDEYSHPCDALGYWCIGAGVVRDMTHKNRSKMGQGTVVISEAFDPMEDWA